MLKRFKKYLTLFLFALSLNASATHIVGGEVYYDYLGGNNYQITVKVYRDCYNGVPPLDGAPGGVAAILNIYNSAGSLVLQQNLGAPVVTLVPPNINSPCFIPPTNVCVEEGIYSVVVNLPPIVGGYDLVYQRCCRNGTILNLNSPGDVGATYMEHIPGMGVVAVNSSPRFVNFPPIYICSGYPIDFDHMAIDPDGDSLVYQLCSANPGLDPCCPTITSSPPSGSSSQCPFPPTSCPSINPPPYGSVPYLPGYSGSYPMSTSPAININQNTGYLNGVPNILGQWVVAVCVSEYRNGVLIGTHKRDFQFNVTNCTWVLVSAIQDQTQLCFGYTVNFQNLSQGAASYSWNFGDPTTTSDVSTLLNPSYTYPDTGRYTVTLITYGATPGCNDTAVSDFEIQPNLNPSFTAPAGQCFDFNSFNFSPSGDFATWSTFDWNFGTSAIPPTSNLQNPNNIHFTAPGDYQVSLTVAQGSCVETFIDTVEVYPMPTAYFDPDSLIGCVPYLAQFSNQSVAGTPMIYLWNFGDGTTSTDANPTHLYPFVGTYDVSLTIMTFNGCIDTSYFNIPGMVTVNPTPTAGLVASPTVVSVFEPDVTFYNFSTNSVNCTLDFGDGVQSSWCQGTYAYTNYGTYTATQIVYNSLGCPDTATVVIKVNPEYRFWVPNAFTPFNGDTLNTVFKPIVIGVDDYKFMIFDRWGEKIFETTDTEAGWDGTYKGHKCQIDVYVYKITYHNLVDDLPYEHHGRVTLVR